jgi:peptidoglycan/xylan/chitin deacetylase (PgdA/CDA1 family)
MSTARSNGTSRIFIFWDYDTQWGGDRSRSPGGAKAWGHAEFENTERLLAIHEEFDIPACFAVVGAAALPGSRPYHDPVQIRQIHEAGHEVASHSFRHDWLPGIGTDGLQETLRASKDALEQCIGAPVVSFVPPYNQPFDHPRGWAFSLSERRAVPRDRIDVSRLCHALRDVGYRFCRLGYRELTIQMLERIRGRELHRPQRLETIGGIHCLRINTPCGFAPEARRAIEAHLDRRSDWVLYGHPHSASIKGGSQSFEMLADTLALIATWRREGKVRCALPRDIIGEAAA